VELGDLESVIAELIPNGSVGKLVPPVLVQEDPPDQDAQCPKAPGVRMHIEEQDPVVGKRASQHAEDVLSKRLTGVQEEPEGGDQVVRAVHDRRICDKVAAHELRSGEPVPRDREHLGRDVDPGGLRDSLLEGRGDPARPARKVEMHDGS
jgi:hypothetical protein